MYHDLLTFSLFFYRPLRDQFMMACRLGELEEIQTLLNELKTKKIDINVQKSEILAKVGVFRVIRNLHKSVKEYRFSGLNFFHQ